MKQVFNTAMSHFWAFSLLTFVLPVWAGGNTWTPMNAGLADLYVNTVVVDSSTAPSTLYSGAASGLDSGVFKWNGNSWSTMNNGLTATNVVALVVDPQANPSSLYAGTCSGGVFQWNGSIWTAMTAGMTNPCVTALAVDTGTRPSTLYAATDGEVYQWDGNSWTGIGAGIFTYRAVYALAVDTKTSPSTLYAGTSYGVHSWNSGTRSWVAMNAGLTNLYALSLAVDSSSSPSALYVGTGGGGVFSWSNETSSWTAINSGLSGMTASCLSVDIKPVGPSTLYAGISDTSVPLGVFKLDGRTGIWTAMNDGLTNLNVFSLAVDPRGRPSALYAAIQGGGVFSYTECPTINLLPISFPTSMAGTPYSQSVTAEGGTAPYTFAVTAGALPAGLSLTSCGLLSGTPPLAGTYDFTVTAMDGRSCTGSRAYSVTVVLPPVITSVTKLSDPFRLDIKGGNFHSACTAYIGPSSVPQTTFKSNTQVIAKSGSQLKAMLPEGVAVQITVRNEDDGGVSPPYTFTR